MRDDRLLRVLRPSLALVALAAVLVLLGLVVTGPAGAATAPPAAEGSKPAKAASEGKGAGSPAAAPAPSAAAVRRGAEVRAGEDVLVPEGMAVPSVVAFGGDVTVDGRATEAVVAFGGDVVVNGSVGQSVVAFGGDIIVRGTVGKTIVAFGGDVTLGKTAVVGFDMPSDEASVVLLGGQLHRAAGAQVHGLVERSTGSFDPGAAFRWGAKGLFFNPLLGLSWVGWLVQTAFFLVLGLVAAALMPGQLRALQTQLARRPWASLGWGALTLFILAPAVLVVLVISVIGLLLVLPYAVFLLLACFFVTTGVATLVAQRALTGFGGRENLMLAVVVGVVGTTVVSRIPVAGPVVLLVMMTFGAGAAALGLAQSRRRRREAQAAQAAAAAAAAAAQQPAGTAGGITPIVQTSPAMQGPPQPPADGGPPQPPAVPPAEGSPVAGAPPVALQETVAVPPPAPPAEPATPPGATLEAEPGEQA